MALIEEDIVVKENNANRKQYIEKGYTAENGVFIVKSSDILNASSIKIHVACDYCGTICETTKRLYTVAMSAPCGKYACKKCVGKKMTDTVQKKYGYSTLSELQASEERQAKRRQTLIEKYGVDNCHDIPLWNEKVHATMREKYGVEWAGQVEEGKLKAQQTNLLRYGATHSAKTKENQEKRKQTNLKRYGVEYVLQSAEFKEKAKETVRHKYGVDYYCQTETARTNARQHFMEQGSSVTSKAQSHICELLGGQLNVPCHGYFIDIVYNDWLAIEYNGTGHDLQVRFGRYTEAEFSKKEKQRTAALIGYGYKLLVLTRNGKHRDDLPADDMLMALLFEAISMLEDSDDSLLELNLDTLNYKTHPQE